MSPALVRTRLPRFKRFRDDLVARSKHLPALHKQLQRVGARAVREVAMAQGNKQSRFLA